MSTFSVVLPYYNEATYLPMVLSSWLGQRRRPDQLVLVDNASTDGSTAVCREVLKDCHDIEVTYLREERPGKIHALNTGCPQAFGKWLVLCDADTYYPPHYLELCHRLAADAPPRLVALMAQDVQGEPNRFWARFKRRARTLLSKIWVRQALTGGFGQILRSDVLVRAGGFSDQYWSYVLLDHEIMQRVLKFGYSKYHVDLWCVPSPRRSDRSRVRWSLFERLMYHFTPGACKDWFFYSFLGPRLARRKMSHLNLREKTWQAVSTED